MQRSEPGFKVEQRLCDVCVPTVRDGQRANTWPAEA
jgi:hypothetical protein